ncbi:hypothetical protein [Rhodomicrobium vannielii]|uniref:hypothetical protein n=1 Tax=Rhodomicrobium vannielii TaxID=1069 RepID=UPI000F73B5DF|nr:hypothetical protein [Rhodomicrobium vannielii]
MTLRILAGCAIIAVTALVAAGVSALTSNAAPEMLAQPRPQPAAKPGDAIQPLPLIRADDAPLSAWEKRWWIDKTARLFRAGQGLSPQDDIERLSKLSKPEIVREFMDDPRFGDTVLDFNMYFLGFKIDDLKEDGAYAPSAYDFPNAISSAKALLTNGDYLKIFDLEGDYYPAPLNVTPSEEDLGPEDAKLTASQLREKAIGEFQARLKALRTLREGPNPMPAYAFCDKVGEVVDQQSEISAKLFRAFTDAEIFTIMRGGIPEFVFTALEKTVDDECEKPEAQVDTQRVVETINTVSTQVKSAFDAVLAFEPTKYEPSSVAEMKPIDRSAFPEGKKWVAFGLEQGTALANSSTNYNRKRAAYVLKRFFCDDLTPVGFEDPAEHVSGAHGSQTSCYACHYKLDPMAGFFRNLGALFGDASSTPDIVFDDLASMDRKTYQATWSAPPGSGRAWNVGYVRSPRWPEQNSYGENLGDLSKIIHEAPEAKRCLMKRLTEYMLGESQTVDGGYLDSLTKSFEQEASENSSVALKNAMLRIVQTDSFQTRNPDPQQCYDYAPGTRPENRPPCRVAYILEKNCVSCHSGKDFLNTLDLSKWIASPDGKGKTFPHLTTKNAQIPASQTLEQIANRVSSSDLKIRMPKNKPMSSQERQELFLWVQKELAKVKD